MKGIMSKIKEKYGLFIKETRITANGEF